ncbi:MAG: tetratricopeptide repeat protein [Janthinobacterium lividum]
MHQPDKTWYDYVNLHANLPGARAAFEPDCEWLLKMENPGRLVETVRADPGDEGIDVLVGNLGQEPIDVYQCKLFLGALEESQKDQIRKSFNRAINSPEFNINSWTLFITLPELSLAETKWWGEWKTKQEQRYHITLTLCDGTELIRRFKQASIYERVFKVESALQLAEMHQALVQDKKLEQVTQLLEKLAAKPSSAEAEALLDVVEQQFIRRYNPRTALRLLTELGKYVEERYGDNAPLLARFAHLLALAHRECGESTAAQAPALRAYRLHQACVPYAARAAQVYAERGELATAQQLAEQLLDQQPLHPVANAVLAYCRRAADGWPALAAVPADVAAEPDFQLPLCELLRELSRPLAEAVLGDALRVFTPPASLTFDNRRYWLLVARLLIQFEVGADIYQNPEVAPVPVAQAPPPLYRAYELLGSYIEQVRGTEKLALNGDLLFLRGLASYYFSGQPTEFDDYEANFLTQPDELRQRYGGKWAWLLAGWSTPAAVLAVLDTLDAGQDANVDYLRFVQLQELGRQAEAQVSLACNLSRAEAIDEVYYLRATIYLGLFCLTVAERLTFVDQCRERGQLTPLLPAKLLAAAALVPDESRWPELRLLLAEVAELLPPVPDPHYVLDLAQLRYAVKDYEAVIATLQLLPPTLSGALRQLADGLHISSLHRLDQHSEDLLQRLAAWRQARPAEYEFCLMELELADLLGDRDRRLAVAAYGHAAFPGDAQLWWQYVLSLHLAGHPEQLRAEIEQIRQLPQPLPRRYLFNVASRAGWTRLARELLYPLAQNPADLLARDHFNKLSVLGQEDPEPEPTEAAVGTTVLFTVDGQPRPPLTLTPEAVRGEHHPFAARLVGRQVGEEFAVPDKMGGPPRQGKIVGLLSAHTALFQEIVRQSERRRATSVCKPSSSTRRALPSWSACSARSSGPGSRPGGHALSSCCASAPGGKPVSG